MTRQVQEERRPPFLMQYLAQGVVIGVFVFLVDYFVIGLALGTRSVSRAFYLAIVAGLLMPFVGPSSRRRSDKKDPAGR